MINFSGLRGAVAFALALSFPGTHRDEWVATTMLIVLATVFVMGGGTVPMLDYLKIRRLKVGETEEEPALPPWRLLSLDMVYFIPLLTHSDPYLTTMHEGLSTPQLSTGDVQIAVNEGTGAGGAAGGAGGGAGGAGGRKGKRRVRDIRARESGSGNGSGRGVHAIADLDTALQTRPRKSSDTSDISDASPMPSPRIRAMTAGDVSSAALELVLAGGNAAPLSPNRPRLPSGAGRSLEAMVGGRPDLDLNEQNSNNSGEEWMMDAAMGNSAEEEEESSIDLSQVPDIVSLTVSAAKTTL
jgi:NhaP-type Na+/H+ or K+/H+ antiporter